MDYNNGVKNMGDDNLHPTVAEFKSFINKHPKLVEKIRKNGSSWQEYYEKWVLLEEDDPYWEQFKDYTNPQQKSDSKTEWVSHLLKMTENIDIKKVQEQVNQLSGTVSTLQEVLGEFKAKEDPTPQRRQFNWFKD